MAGHQSDLLDLYWQARHGHPIPDAAWPAVLAARQVIEGGYLPLESLISTLQRAPDG